MRERRQPERRSAAEWGRIVQEQRRSGMSVAAFAAAEGLNRHTLQWWRSHLRGKGGEDIGPPAFIEIAGPISTASTGLEAVLPSGVVVRGHDGEAVARLITALLRQC